MANESMAISPLDSAKKFEQITPNNTSAVVRDYLNEDSTLWSIPRKEVVQLQLASIQNPFHSKWALWYMEEEDTVSSWFDRLQCVTRIKNIEQFWALYAYVLRPCELPISSGYCFFKDGIKPVWIDMNNLNGGQWAISIPKPQDESIDEKLNHLKKLSKYWKTLLIAMAGEQFEIYSGVICGAVVTIDEDIDEVSLWIKNVSDDENIAIGNIFRQLLKLPDDGNVRFEKHPLKMSPVLTAYGLSQKKFNCDKVFNLLCSYGDCLKILFSRDGRCTIQMRTEEGARSVIDHLNGCVAFGEKVTFISIRKKEIGKLSKRCLFKMAGGSLSFADFSESPNLRFVNPENASKNCALEPTKNLRFFNAPANITTNKIRKIFENHGIRPKMSSIQERSHLTTSGFVIFGSVDEAINALILCNHTMVVGPYQKNTHAIQLSFC